MEQHIQTASFVEMIVVNPTQVSNPDFDIILDEKVTLQNYCNALIEIICKQYNWLSPTSLGSLTCSIAS